MKTLKIKNKTLRQTASGINLDDSRWDRISSKKSSRKKREDKKKKKKKKKKGGESPEKEEKIVLEELPKFSYEINKSVTFFFFCGQKVVENRTGDCIRFCIFSIIQYNREFLKK